MIKITTDSTCDLPRSLLEQHDITVIPLGIVKAGRLYQDGVDIRIEDIAAHVDAGGDITTTNAVNIADYEDVFRRMTERYDAVIHINIGMQFSSCHQNAKLAAEEVPEVYVVDSSNLTVGHGMLVLAAAEAAEAGKSVSEILDLVEDMIPRVETSFVLDRLDYMKKGGRCSAVTALGANLLKLHPCVEVIGGKMSVTKKYLPHAGPARSGEGVPGGGRPFPGDHREQGRLHHFLPLRPGYLGYHLPAQVKRHEKRPPEGGLFFVGCLLDGDGLHLAQNALGQFLHSHAAAGGLGSEELGIGLVEGGEVAHVRQEAGGLDHVFKAHTGSGQNGAHVLAALLRLSGDALGDGAGGGVHGDLAGRENQIAHRPALRVGADGAGSVGGFDNRFVHGKIPPLYR